MVHVKKALVIFVGVALTLMLGYVHHVHMPAAVRAMARRLETISDAPLGQLRGTSKDLAKEVVDKELISEKVNNKEVVQEEVAVPSAEEVNKVAADVAYDYNQQKQQQGVPMSHYCHSGICISEDIWYLIDLAIALIFAFFYKQKVVDHIQPLPPATFGQPGAMTQTDFKYGMFSCFDDTNICLHAWCCAGCRVAHNTQVTGVMDYWTAIGAMILSGCLFCIPCLPICLQAWFRMETKKKLGIPSDAPMDFICSCCCNCCAIAQAAREVDERSGVVVKCCFDLKQQARSPVVMGVASAPPATEMAYPR